MIASEHYRMELILWRHADAGDPFEDQTADLERRLTPRGRKQSLRVAKWLAARLPERYLLISSPAPRALETAQALGPEPRVDPRLAPGATGEQLLAAINWPEGPDGRARHCVVVGHQPSLGEAAALAITGQAAAWTIRKSAILWLASRGEGAPRPPLIRAAIGPDLV
jgi:phosphohistidine phosphatase